MADAPAPTYRELQARILELEQALAWFAEPRHYEAVNGYEPAVMKRGIRRAKERLKWAKGKSGYRTVYAHIDEATKTVYHQRQHLAHLQRAVNRQGELLRELIGAAREMATELEASELAPYRGPKTGRCVGSRARRLAVTVEGARAAVQAAEKMAGSR